jgi:hypothetical protein
MIMAGAYFFALLGGLASLLSLVWFHNECVNLKRTGAGSQAEAASRRKRRRSTATLIILNVISMVMAVLWFFFWETSGRG